MAWKNVKAFCKDNSNTIFTVFACIFTVGTAVATVVETAKACKDISDAEYDKWEELGEPEEPNVDISLTTAETIKLVWPRYIIPAIGLAGSLTFEILAWRSGQNKIEALTGAYVIAAQTLSSVRESIRTNLPNRDVQRIESDVIHKAVEQDRTEANNKIALLQSQGSTTTIYRDAYSPSGAGVYFKCDINQARKAVHLYNKSLEENSKIGLKCSLNDWYDCLTACGINMGHSDMGDVLEFSWEEDGPMQLYIVCDRIDPDYDDNAIIAIGLRRKDASEYDLALPTTPKGIYS